MRSDHLFRTATQQQMEGLKQAVEETNSHHDGDRRNDKNSDKTLLFFCRHVVFAPTFPYTEYRHKPDDNPNNKEGLVIQPGSTTLTDGMVL